MHMINGLERQIGGQLALRHDHLGFFDYILKNKELCNLSLGRLRLGLQPLRISTVFYAHFGARWRTVLIDASDKWFRASDCP